MRPATEGIKPELISDRYRVQREIGRGGMATVYLCTDTRDDQLVAVKVLRAELGSAVVVERFFREIAFASELDHPQIPKVLDSGVMGDLPFYVMTFIEGESLRARLDKVKQLTVEEAVRITQQVIVPTAYAHARGIVHRDLKPGNILLAGDNVYVLDFGIARAIMASAEDSLTSTGVAVGTPAYMSPEQALADHAVDARSDIYSLACVTYEMLAGMPPFVGATAQAVMARRFVAPPPPLSEVREGVPAAVEQSVLKALCKAPADRWQKVEDFGNALTAPIVSPSLVAQQAVFDGRKRKYGVAVGATVVGVLAIAAAVAWTMSGRDHLATGRTAMEAWNLSKAESEFSAALKKDPSSPSAKLWMSQLLILKRAPLSDWAELALKAADDSANLKPEDRLRAAALARYADKDKPGRCDVLRTLSKTPDRLHPDDFSAGVAFADCLASDPTVVEDKTTPSGYRFASSFEQAALVYEGVLARNSTNGQAYTRIMPRLTNVLWTNKNAVRAGVLQSNSQMNFVSSPVLIADTIAFIPYPASVRLPPDPDRQSRLVERNLEKLSRLTTSWAAAAPGDPSAQETLSGVLEGVGKFDGPGGSALASITTARLQAESHPPTDTDPFVQKLRLASGNIRLLLKLSRFRDARILADSAILWKVPAGLTESDESVSDGLRSGLLGLTGRMEQLIQLSEKDAADYQVRIGAETKTLPADIGADVLRLEAYCEFGGPADSILVLDKRIRENIDLLGSAEQTNAFRAAVLRRPLSLALQTTGPSLLASLRGESSDEFIEAVKAVAAGNTALARKHADAIDAFRGGAAAGEVTMDAVLQQAWLRSALGDDASAARQIDRALKGISRAPSTLLRGSTKVTALVRAMQFRADLAAKVGDEETRKRWSDAVQELWANADAAIKPSTAAVHSRSNVP